ncbi:LysM peptidoglycan-binding domain-containing protein [Neogemmobacter tilapiae]|nr:LysM peptidoglycan-binding domain-containing protein [Gemmobacter tilapiae]
MTPAFSWALAMVVAGAVVVIAVVAILPKEPSVAPNAPQPVAAFAPDKAQPAAEVATVTPAPTEPKIEAPPATPVVAAPEPAPEPAPPEVAEVTAPPAEDPAEAEAIAALELPTLETPAEATVAPEPKVEAKPVSAPEPEPAPEPASPDPVAPSFDTVRVEPDGAALVAGRADPGARVALMVEGKPLAEVTADAAGNFVAMFDLPADAQPRLMSLLATDGAGQEMPSSDSVAIAPIAAPVVEIAVAEAPAVSEPAQAPAALVVSPEGARLAQAEPAPSPVTIDTFSFDAAGAAQLSGRGAAGASVRLYLDNAEMALVQVGESGLWQADLAAVEPGSYVLRADQMGPGGQVLARVEQEVTREAMPEPAVEPEPMAVAEPVPAAPEPEAAANPETAPPAPLTVTVKPGYSLWRIANEQMGDGVMYVQVFEANKDQIRNPDLIYPGQVFTIPAP